MLWFSTSGRAAKIASSASASPLQSEMSTSTCDARACAGGWPRWWRRRPPAPPSARSSRATVVTTANARPMRSTASATRSGSSGSSGLGVAGVDQAEAAGPGAALAVDHERGRAVGPALGDVGAARLLAHGDQVEVAHGALERAGTRRRARPGPASTRACARRWRGRSATPASASRPGRRTDVPSTGGLATVGRDAPWSAAERTARPAPRRG